MEDNDENEKEKKVQSVTFNDDLMVHTYEVGNVNESVQSTRKRPRKRPRDNEENKHDSSQPLNKRQKTDY